MWLSFLSEYSKDLGGMMIMVLIPYLLLVPERLARLTAYGQTDRIPRWLQWIPWADPHFRKAMKQGEIPSDSKKWILLELGVGSILPTVCLVRGADPLGHRIIVVLASVLEWLVRPRESKGQ